jgi:hypothetical protein
MILLVFLGNHKVSIESILAMSNNNNKCSIIYRFYRFLTRSKYMDSLFLNRVQVLLSFLHRSPSYFVLTHSISGLVGDVKASHCLPVLRIPYIIKIKSFGSHRSSSTNDKRQTTRRRSSSNFIINNNEILYFPFLHQGKKVSRELKTNSCIRI